MSVDLPEPDGPMTAVRRPRGDVDRDAAERVDGGVALAVAADDVAGADTTGGRWRSGVGAGEECVHGEDGPSRPVAPGHAGRQASAGAAMRHRRGRSARGGLEAQVREHGEDAAVVVARPAARPSLAKTAVTCFCTPRCAELEPLADRLVRAALGEQLEHLALARR